MNTTSLRAATNDSARLNNQARRDKA